MQKLIDLLILHEGKRSMPYECSAGKITVGVGRNLEDNPLSDDEITYLLKNDITRCERQLNRYAWFRMQDSVRQECLINLCFNIGLTGILRFKKMIACLEARNPEGAAEELLDSRYSEQVGNRALDLAYMLREGVYP